MISFVIPAYNEERYLGRTLAALAVAAPAGGRPFEVIVVDDASTDRTAAVAREHGATVLSVQHRKISAVRNAGARAAAGDILFFIDADTLANPTVVRAGVRAIANGAAGGGCVFKYDGPLRPWARVMHPMGIAAGRALKLIGGCFLFCRRDVFEAVGGFDENLYAAEDVAFVRAVKRRGRFVIPRELVVTSNRKLAGMTAWRAVKLLAEFAIRGESAYRSRDGLGLWYGPEARAD